MMDCAACRKFRSPARVQSNRRRCRTCRPPTLLHQQKAICRPQSKLNGNFGLKADPLWLDIAMVSPANHLTESVPLNRTGSLSSTNSYVPGVGIVKTVPYWDPELPIGT